MKICSYIYILYVRESYENRKGVVVLCNEKFYHLYCAKFLTEEIRRRGAQNRSRKHIYLFSRPTVMWLTDVLSADLYKLQDSTWSQYCPLIRPATLPCCSYFVG